MKDTIEFINAIVRPIVTILITIALVYGFVIGSIGGDTFVAIGSMVLGFLVLKERRGETDSMKHIAAIMVLALSGCVSPTFTIYREGTVKTAAKTKDGSSTTSKAVAVKALQFYSDLDGDVTISGAGFYVHATGGINNSRLAKVNWDGATAMARATIQPIVFGALGAGAVNSAAGAARILVK